MRLKLRFDVWKWNYSLVDFFVKPCMHQDDSPTQFCKFDCYVHLNKNQCCTSYLDAIICVARTTISAHLPTFSTNFLSPWYLLNIWYIITESVSCPIKLYGFLYNKICDIIIQGASWPWSYGSWIYNYLCNQFLSPLMFWVQISIREKCTTLCDKVCQWPATVSSTNKTDRHDITEILLKGALNTINQANIIIQSKLLLSYRKGGQNKQTNWQCESKNCLPWITSEFGVHPHVWLVFVLLLFTFLCSVYVNRVCQFV
jgi:hypothetical protein